MRFTENYVNSFADSNYNFGERYDIRRWMW